MRRFLATVAVLTATLASTAACGGDDNGSDPSSTETKVIKVSISGDTVTPNGDRVEVAVDQPIELQVTADAAGEIHVHSSPEQEFQYDTGTTTLKLDPIKTPSVVEVESHTLDKTIVQLEAR
jgi:hypothetical protein